MIINDDAGYGIIKYILSMVYICEIPPSSNFCLEDIYKHCKHLTCPKTKLFLNVWTYNSLMYILMRIISILQRYISNYKSLFH